MTGRDLITYILNNHLEDVDLFDGLAFLGFPSVNDVAVIYNVGPATVRTWIALGYLKAIVFNGCEYIVPSSIEKLDKVLEIYHA